MLGRLTDVQVRRVLHHKRDTKGALVAPVVLPVRDKGKPKAARFPQSLEEELRQILPLQQVITRENYEEMIKTIYERWKTGQRNGAEQ